MNLICLISFFFFIFVEHSIPIDIDKLNYESIERDYNLWDAVEGSGWLSVEGGIEAH